MLFTSPAFLILLTLTWVTWYSLPRMRLVTLLVASSVFIASFSVVSLAVCLVMAMFNFLAGRAAGNRNLLVYRCMQVMNLALIPLSGFLNGQVLFFCPGANDAHVVLMAAGLSFYNLQHFAYLTDVYKGRIQPEREFTYFLGAALYFPKLVSGPLVRYQEFRPLLEQPVTDNIPLWPAVNRMLLGFFKKMVIADALALSVSSVFDHHDALPGLTILAGAFLFTLQLYFDFSGYCDIAIGCSRLFGIALPENFNFPLRARSMTEFWRRWHMTLLRFFSDYLFLPLTFRYRAMGKTATASGMVLVFLASAVWHGLGLTFILWGMCHAAYMLAEFLVKKQAGTVVRLPGAAKGLLTMILFSFSNVFFRSADWQTCEHLLRQLFYPDRFLPADWPAELVAPLAAGGHQADLFNFYTLLFITMTFLLMEKNIFRHAEEDRWRPLPVMCVVILILVFGVFSNTHRFIYMQF